MAKSDKDPRKKKPSRERRRHPVGRDPRREARRERALERGEIRAARSTEDQLLVLNGRAGESARERARLA
jgi:hypothetical protein